MKGRDTIGTTVYCSHCGDSCDAAPIYLDNHPFCCEGCKTVFQLLKQSGLDDYYVIEKTPGVKRKARHGDHRFDFLMNLEIADKLLQFREGDVANITLFLPQIHCSSCIWLLENLHRLNPAVYRSEVNFVKKEAFITFDISELPLYNLADLLSTIGYPPHITLESEKEKKDRKPERTLLYKIGVAGFCFGNIMLLSFPEYLYHASEIEDQFRSAFGWVNLLLSLPVMFYAASDYFRSAWAGVRFRSVNIDIPIALGILALFLRSTFDIVSGNGPGFMDSLSGLVFFLLIGKWYQSRTYSALSFEREYESYFPIGITKIVNGEEIQTAIRDLKEGDQILVRNAELIPADCKLTEGEGQIDYSFVTGETVSTQKLPGDLLYAGGRQVGGSIIADVVKPVSQSYLTQLWNQEVFTKKEGKHLSVTIQKVSKIFTFSVLAIALCTAMYWSFTDPSQVFLTLTAVLIIACPCALALTLPFTFGTAMRILGRNGLYLKHADTIETLAGIDTIVFDKTGTLTMGSESTVSWSGEYLSPLVLGAIRSLTRQSSHPYSRIIYLNLNEAIMPVSDFKEIPFKGIEGKVNGRQFRIGSDVYVTREKHSHKDLDARIYVSVDGRNIGYFRIAQCYRPDMQQLLNTLRPRFGLFMLSGDDDTQRNQLATWFEEDRMKFRQSPIDKLNTIQQLQNQGKKVLMAGDGLNDAGALKQANAGLAVSDDLYCFSPACDAIVDGNSLNLLPQFMSFARRAMKIAYVSFFISFLYNLTGLYFAVTGQLSPLFAAILMPLSSVTVVIFTTGALYAKKVRASSTDLNIPVQQSTLS